MFCLVCLVISNVNEILTQIDISMVLGADIQILKKNLFVVIWIVECYSKFSIMIMLLRFDYMHCYGGNINIFFQYIYLQYIY